MQVSKSMVEKLVITDAAMPDGMGKLDPITVFAEDFGPGQGKMTITCFGEAWSHYWSSMGEGNKLADFFCKCDTDYIVRKLKTGISQAIDDDDDDALTELLRKQILHNRRNNEITKPHARELWDEAGMVEWGARANICSEVFGDDWYHCMPRKPNPDYTYLTQIVKAVKSALSTLKGDS